MIKLSKALKLIPNHRIRQFPLLSILMVIGAAFEVIGISLVIPLTEVLSGGSTNRLFSLEILGLGTFDQNELLFFCLILFATAYVIKGIYLSFLAWLTGRYIFAIKAEVSHDLMKSYLNAPFEFHLSNNSAQLIRNITTETHQLVANVMNPILIIATEIVVIIAICLLLIILEPIGSITIILVLVFLAFTFQKIVGRYSSKLGEVRQRSDGLLIQKAQEAIGGIKDIKVLGKIRHFLDRFSQSARTSANVAAKQHIIVQIPRLYLETISVLILCFLALFITSNGGSPNDVFSALSVYALSAFRLMPSANRILFALSSLRYAETVINALNEHKNIKNEKLKYDDGRRGKSYLPFENCIQLKEVFYAYPNTEKFALCDVSFSINKGESIGIIGKSGSGKSTLSDVLLGLLTPHSGSITLDGVNIQDNIQGWRNKVGYVQQDIFLLDDSFCRNIAFGFDDKTIDYARMSEVLIEARLDAFISSLPKGLNTPLGERGIRLSGGQKQRIGIARALYRKNSVIVFDEATSALDNETEREIVTAIKSLSRLRTIIVIAHRHSTIEHCDRIVEISDGKVIRILKPTQLTN